MQAGKVSSLSAFPFGRADISIRERSNLSKGKDVCVRSTRHVPRFPWQPQAVRAPVSKQPAGFHQCLRCGNVVWFLSIRPAFSLCLRCLPKKSRVGSLRRKTAVRACLFWLLAATLSMLGEQTHCGGGGGGGVHSVTLLTVHHFSICAMLLFRLTAVLSVFKTFFSFSAGQAQNSRWQH